MSETSAQLIPAPSASAPPGSIAAPRTILPAPASLPREGFVELGRWFAIRSETSNRDEAADECEPWIENSGREVVPSPDHAGRQLRNGGARSLVSEYNAGLRVKGADIARGRNHIFPVMC
jgi:hypothetical protein